MMQVRSDQRSYTPEQLIAATAAYRLYLAKDNEIGEWRLLQVARDLQSNGGLSRSAYILDMFQGISHDYDLAYGKDHGGKHLHYDRLFPRMIESFTNEEQGGRRINILAFTDVSDTPGLLPLSNLRDKDRVIIDLKTGAWILGRLLKLLGFAHEQGVAVRSIRANNILLDKDQHFAVVFDWTAALVFPSKVSSEAARVDIVRAAEAVLASCGITSHGVPYTLSSDEARYIDLLRDFADGNESDTVRAHTRFYRLVREIWDTEFHPFTTLPITR